MPLIVFNRALSSTFIHFVFVYFRMELSGVYFLVSISILSVLVKEFANVSEAKVGLAMVYTLQLTGINTIK
jgi:hypothetical protein